MMLKLHNSVTLAIAFSFGMMLPSCYAANFGADRHLTKGVTCETCHGKNMNKESPEIPDGATCIKCHDKAALAEKTKGLPGANPHAAPHNGDCTLCHMQHEEAVNYCAQCHQFDFKVK